jgi:cation transporter-like permease
MRKTIVTGLTLAALIAAPTFTRIALADDNGVWIGSNRIGMDPDATVRLMIRRDYGSTSGGN